jgi:hypothetical protein
MVYFVSPQHDGRRSLNVVTGMTGMAFLACLLIVVVVSPLAAQPAKGKEATTKQSTVAELKPDAVPAGTPAANQPADPVVCVTPSAADAADPAASPVGDDKASASAKASTSDADAVAESGNDSSDGFMKDKLKLSLGGKSGSASDQPQQCGLDEAGAQDKNKEK